MFDYKQYLSGQLAAERPLAERVHDLKEAQMTLGYFKDDLDKGYKFDDRFAEAKTRTLLSTINLLEKEIDVLMHLYNHAR